MSDHHAMESEGPWPAGWIWAVAAAVVAAILTRWLADVSVQAAILLGLMVFVVYGVLLAQFWEAPAEGPDAHGHGHDDHGHDHADHGHDVHGHAATASVQPQGLSGARNGAPDALQEIEGIGPVLERLCHDLGIFHYDQIAAWEAAEVAWMDANLKGFKSRVSRDKWVAQARLIGAEGIEAFRIRAKTNNY